MLYEVKIMDKNLKIKKIISPKNVQKMADQKFKEGFSAKVGAQRFRNNRLKKSKNN